MILKMPQKELGVLGAIELGWMLSLFHLQHEPVSKKLALWTPGLLLLDISQKAWGGGILKE